MVEVLCRRGNDRSNSFAAGPSKDCIATRERVSYIPKRNVFKKNSILLVSFPISSLLTLLFISHRLVYRYPKACILELNEKVESHNVLKCYFHNLHRAPTSPTRSPPHIHTHRLQSEAWKGRWCPMFLRFCMIPFKLYLFLHFIKYQEVHILSASTLGLK